MTRPSKSISDDCSALAFYGIRPSPKAAEDFYHAMVEWFGRLATRRTRAGLRHPVRYATRLLPTPERQAGEEGLSKVTGVTVVATTPGAEYWDSDCYAAASYMGDDDELTAYMWRGPRSPRCRQRPCCRLPEVAQLLKPVYGISTPIGRLDAGFYAIGLNFDPGDLTPRNSRNRSGSARGARHSLRDQVYRKGILRDVYPWNFLTRPHLKKKVDGVPLEQWIRQNARRGGSASSAAGCISGNWLRNTFRGPPNSLRAGLILEPEEDDYVDPEITPEESLAVVFRTFESHPRT